MRIGSLVPLLAAVCCAVAGTAGAQTVRVAMLPISVNSSLTETEYLRSGLADMLAARLEQGGQLVIIRLPEAVATRKEAIEAAREAGAQFALFGSYTQFGDGASLDLRCASVAEGDDSGKPRRVFIQAGSPAAIIPQLEDLAIRMGEYMAGAEVSTGPPRVDGAPDATTTAPAATDLERRVQALERAVFPTSVADGTLPAE